MDTLFRLGDWWSKLPAWRKWTYGLVLLLILGFVLLAWSVFRRPSTSQVEAAVEARETAKDIAETATEAEKVSADADTFAGELQAELDSSKEQDARADEAAKQRAEEAGRRTLRDGDMTRDLGDGVRGGSLKDL